MVTNYLIYLSWPQTHNSPSYWVSNTQSGSYKQMKTFRTKARFFPPVISGRHRLSLKHQLNIYQGNLKIKIRKMKEPRYKLRQSSVESCPPFSTMKLPYYEYVTCKSKKATKKPWLPWTFHLLRNKTSFPSACFQHLHPCKQKQHNKNAKAGEHWYIHGGKDLIFI